MRPRRTGGTLVALCALLAVTAAGCASKKQDEGIATAGGQATTAPAATATANQGEQFRKFAQCMRDKGVDVPDPGPDGTYSFDGEGNGPGQGTDIDRDDPKVQTALNACRSLMPAGGIPLKLNPQQLELYRKFAACMREKGIDFPDPNADGSLGLDLGNMEQLMERRNDPAFRTAAQACIGTFSGATPKATP
jgi:hypothetical protein